MLSSFPGCNAMLKIRDIPGHEIEKEYINSDLRLFAPDGWNSYEFGDPVSIVVEVVGDDPILFTGDYDISIFQKNGSLWSQVESVPKSRTDGVILLNPSEGDPKYYGAASIIPIIEDQTKPVKLRVVLVGHIFLNGEKTDQMVGAYTDVKLYP